MLIDANLLICINMGCIYWLCALLCIQENGTHAVAVRSLEIRNDICLQLADFKSRTFEHETNSISTQFILYLANVITLHRERKMMTYRKVMDVTEEFMTQFNVEMKANSVFLLYLHSNFKKKILSPTVLALNHNIALIYQEAGSCVCSKVIFKGTKNNIICTKSTFILPLKILNCYPWESIPIKLRNTQQ